MCKKQVVLCSHAAHNTLVSSPSLASENTSRFVLGFKTLVMQIICADYWPFLE